MVVEFFEVFVGGFRSFHVLVTTPISLLISHYISLSMLPPVNVILLSIHIIHEHEQTTYLFCAFYSERIQILLQWPYVR